MLGRLLPVLTLLVLALYFPIAADAQTATPDGWVSVDVGSPLLAGTAVYVDDTLTIKGAGAGFDDTGDEFHFVYRPFSGDIDMTVRLIDLQSSGGQAGLMIRESLDPSSASAVLSLGAAQDVTFRARNRDGHRSSVTAWPGATSPLLRLVRSGRTINGYISDTGSTWTLLDSANLNLGTDALIGLAVTSGNPSEFASATFSSFVFALPVPPPTLPTPWSSQDIGEPAISGAASAADGVFTVTGSGIDIWHATDQFQYVYQPVTGDTEILARVASFQTTNSWGKAGVMIRSALTASAAHVSLFATGSSGWAFQGRLSDAGPSYSSSAAAGPAPGWVRLVREGALMSAYYSTDGSNWTFVDTETVQMPSTIYVGLAVTSHDSSVTSTAGFSNVVVSAPIYHNVPPTVAITEPSSGAIFPAATAVAVTAAASDSDGTVNMVEFFANGTPIGTSTATPFMTTWPNVAAGTYSLTAVATDNGGGASTSPSVLITVAAAPPPSVPTRVVFTPPVDYATNVTSCAVQLRRATDPLSASPIAARDLGKPTPLNGEVSVDITTLVDPLAPGSYYAVVVATGPGGSTPSSPSNDFTR